MNSREFTLEDQLQFAKLSGDYNPIHIDTVAARRLIFGSIVVHGVHSALWALDHWLQDKTEKVELVSLKVSFVKPIRVGEEVSYSLKSERDRFVEIVLLVQDSVVTKLSFQWQRSSCHASGCYALGLPKRDECKVLSPQNVEKTSGELPLFLDFDTATALFKNAVERLSPLQIAQLLSTTRLVGMECPGLNSTYSSIELVFLPDLNTAPVLSYKIAKLNARYGLISMNIASPMMTGVVTALFRPAPQAQICLQQLHRQVKAREFADQRALVIGGSRGIGEVTAKILAVGGAEVKLTYYKGVDDAQRVVDEINAGGGCGDRFLLDVLDTQSTVIDKLPSGWFPTHVYYFPTPFIALGKKGDFSASLFHKFCEYYVVGFQRIVEQLSTVGLKAVFYPSSVYVDELPSDMGEYAAAKMAGEVVCTLLNKTKQEITVYAPRLPRMATDQTASFMTENDQDSVSIMLRHLHRLTDELASSQ